MTSSLQSFSLVCFKKAEKFENLDNILRDWAKEKISTRTRRGRRKKTFSFLGNGSEKIFEQSQSAVSSLSLEVSSALNILLFADDTKIFFSHKVSDSLCLTVNNELVQLTDWLFANKLSINIKKSNYIFF